MKKVLLLGGTGAIGKSLVNYLNTEEMEVYVTTRKNIQDKENIKYIQGNAHEIDFLKKILFEHEFDVIVDFMLYSYEELKRKIELFLENTKQYIFISSARVYSNLDENICENTKRLLDVCEDKEYLMEEEYALEKAKEEDLLINNKKNNWTIVRPYITYNDNRFQLGVYEKEEWLYRVLKNKKIAIQKNLLEKITTLTYGGDVAKYISYLIGNEKTLGEIYQIANNDSKTTWLDVLNIYKRILNEYGMELRVEVIDEKYDKILPINYYQLIYDRYYNRKFNSNKLSTIVESTFMEPEEGLKKCLNKFIATDINNNVFLEPKFTGIMDKITNEKTDLNEFKTIKDIIKYILARYTNFYETRKKLKGIFKYKKCSKFLINKIIHYIKNV